MPHYLDIIREKREKAEKELASTQSLRSLKDISSEVARQGSRSRVATQPVKVSNQIDLTTLHKLIGELKDISITSSGAAGENSKGVEAKLELVTDATERVINAISSLILPTNQSVTEEIRELRSAVSSLELSPQIEVKPPEVNVEVPDVKVKVPEIKIPSIKVPDIKIERQTIDIKPVVRAIEHLTKTLQPDTGRDTQEELVSAIQTTTDAITNLRFPIPNYILPYSQSGKAAQVGLETDGSIPVTVKDGGSSSSGKPTDAYALSNIDDATTTEYYGYEDKDGKWYIKRLVSNTFTFSAGSSNYSAAWTGRASQTYASYATTF